MRIAVRIALFFGLALAPGLSLSQEGPQSPHTARTLPDSALQKLANDYFADYSNKDLQGMTAQWDGRSPDRDSRTQQLHGWFVSASTRFRASTTTRSLPTSR